MKDVLITGKKKNRCEVCGKKIGRLDRMKLKLMQKAVKVDRTGKASREFEELKDHCPDCLAKIFKERAGLAMQDLKEQLGDKPIPKKFRKAFEKAGLTNKEEKK